MLNYFDNKLNEEIKMYCSNMKRIYEILVLNIYQDKMSNNDFS